MSTLEKLETRLGEMFEGAPQLRKTTRKALANWWPPIALIFGILQLLAAWLLWHAGHITNQVIDYANSIAQAYGSGAVVQHLGLFFYLALGALVVDAVILLMAYPSLRRREHYGWQLLLLGALLNLVYGVAAAFQDYGGVSRLVWAFFTTVIGLYFLYQVHDEFMVGAAHHKKTAAKK